MAIAIRQRNGLTRFALVASLALGLFSSTASALFAQSIAVGSDLKMSYQKSCALPKGAPRGSRSGVKVFSTKPDAQGKRLYYIGGKGGCYTVFEAVSYEFNASEDHFYDLFDVGRDYDVYVDFTTENAVSQQLAKKITSAKEKCLEKENKTFVPRLGGTEQLSCIKRRLISDLKDMAWIYIDFSGEDSSDVHSSNLWFDHGSLIGILEVHLVDGTASFPSWSNVEEVK